MDGSYFGPAARAREGREPGGPAAAGPPRSAVILTPAGRQPKLIVHQFEGSPGPVGSSPGPVGAAASGPDGSVREPAAAF